MISCPNCGKSVADEAVHCGHCGHKIEPATNQKTMMGFSLSPEDLQKAIAEAGQQRAAQAAEPVDELGRTEILPSVGGNPALSDTLDPDSEVGAEAEQFAAQAPLGDSFGFGNMEPKNDVLDGLSSTPSVHDPFEQPSMNPFEQSVTPMQQSSMQTNFPGSNDGAGEESFIEKNKKMLIIGGGILAVLFGCCIIGVIVQLIM